MLFKKTSFAKKLGMYLVGNMASRILMALLVPYYAYFVSVEDLGRFDYYQIQMFAFTPILFCALWESILRYVISEEDVVVKHKYINTSMYFVSIVTFVSMTLASIYYIYSKEHTFLMVISMICSRALAQFWQYFARALGYSKEYVSASVAGTFINVIILIGLVNHLHMGSVGLIISYIVGQFSIFLIIERRIKIFNQIKISDFDFELLVKMLKFSIPLVLNLTSIWFMTGFGRILITNILDSFQNGLFSFAYKFANLVNMLGTVVSMAFIEEIILAEKDNEFSERFSKSMNTFTNVFLFMGVMAMPAIYFFYYITQSTAYHQSYILVPPLVLFAVLTALSTNVATVFQAKDRTNYILNSTLVSALVTIVFSFFLIRDMGILGVAIGQLVGAIFQLAQRYVYAKKIVRIKIHVIKPLLTLAINGLVWIVFIQKQAIGNLVIIIILCVIACGINFDIIRGFINKADVVFRKTQSIKRTRDNINENRYI